ncbi:MAG TPA: hypothetical protein ENJ04_01100 [Nitrospirae bacterium]|nr:hypothetical protein [Nitrospirota bacterium]
MGLLKLPEEIQRTLPGLDDQRAIRYFSERRLRPLLMIPDQARQIQEFNRMLAESANPAIKLTRTGPLAIIMIALCVWEAKSWHRYWFAT